MILRVCLAASILFLSLILFQCSRVDSTGAKLYEDHCQVCHMDNGQGLEGFIPPIANADYILENRGSLACVIRNGLSGEITVNDELYDVEMQAISLSDVEITNLLNYIMSTWYSGQDTFTLTEVNNQLTECIGKE